MASVVDWNSLQSTSSLIGALPDALRKSARICRIARGGYVFRRGDRPKAMYFVVKGDVHLLRHSSSGHDVILQRARAGFLAEASLDQSAYHCDALAVGESRLLQFPQKAFVEALTIVEFRSHWIAHLSRELRRVRAQAERLALKTARERIIHYLETEGEDGFVALVRPKKQWAAELGLTHEALYRALRRMEEDREIVSSGRQLRLGRAR